jgi:hypothetical protein
MAGWRLTDFDQADRLADPAPRKLFRANRIRRGGRRRPGMRYRQLPDRRRAPERRGGGRAPDGAVSELNLDSDGVTARRGTSNVASGDDANPARTSGMVDIFGAGRYNFRRSGQRPLAARSGDGRLVARLTRVDICKPRALERFPARPERAT